MNAHPAVPILNVSDMQTSFAWFTKLGRQIAWEWENPPSFAAVHAGHCEVFLCLDGQGSRGRSDRPMTFGPEGDRVGNRGVWMWIAVDDVDELHRRCLAEGLDVTWPPTNMPWGSRELHLRHPDGHIFRFAQGIDCESEEA